MPRLILISDKEEQIFDMLEDELGIGRAPENELPLGDSGLSRQHCRIYRDGPGYSVEDLQSSNGTRVNGKRIDRCRLRKGDTISIGKVDIRFEWLPDEIEESESQGEAPEAQSPPLVTDRDASTDRPRPAEKDSRKLSAPAHRFKLILLGNKSEQTEFEFDNDDTITIGRAPGQRVQLDDEKVSGRHARLVSGPEGCNLVDENSRNGTFVDGQRISEHLLKSGEILRIGKRELRFIDNRVPPMEISPEKAGRSEERQRGKTEARAAALLSAGQGPAEEAGTERPDPDEEKTSVIPSLRKTSSEIAVPVRSGDTRPLLRAAEALKWRESNLKQDGQQPSGKPSRSGPSAAAQEVDVAVEEEDDDEAPTPVSMEKTDTKCVEAKASGRPEEGKKGTRGHGEPAKEEEPQQKETTEKQTPESPARAAVRADPKALSRESTIIGTVFAIVMAAVILGGAIWFVLPEDMRPFSGSKSTPSKPSGREQPSSHSNAGTSQDRGPQTAGSETTPASADPSGNSPDDTDDAALRNIPSANSFEMESVPAEGDPVMRPRPLNATRRVQNYDFLKDLAVELANLDETDQERVSDADNRRLARVREMIFDFQLEEAGKELQGVQSQSSEAKNLGDQLKWISGILQSMDEALARGDRDVPLQEIAPGAGVEGTILGVSHAGIRVRSPKAKEELVRWRALTPDEKYALARRCTRETEAADHVGLAILCLNLKLPKEAEEELNRAEKLGFPGIQRYREHLKRQIDFLR